MKAIVSVRNSLLACLCLALCLSAQRLGAEIRLDESRSAELVAGAPGLEQYPAAGALILYQGTQLKVLDDGAKEFTDHRLIKILQDRGRSFSDQKRNYDSETDSVEVLLARTWLPDGSTVAVENKAINVITPPELTGAAVYADIKQKVISFGGIQPGAVIEILTRTVSQPDSADRAGDDYYWDMSVFRGSEPILNKRYELLISGEAPEPSVVIRNGLPQAKAEHVEINGNRYLQYAWEMHDVEMIQSIPSMPPTINFAPWLIFSDAPDWNSLGSWLAGRFYPSVQTGGKIRTLTDSLLSGRTSRADSVRALALYVEVEVRNISLALSLTGYEPTPASEVLDNMYGHSLDKALLLVSMLKAAGIEAQPAFSSWSTIDLLEQDVPTPAQFDRMLVYVPGHFTDSTFVNPLYGRADRDGLWLYPYAQYSRYGYFSNGQGCRALVVTENGGELKKVDEYPPEKSLSLVRANLSLSENGDVDGEFDVTTDGLFDNRARNSLKDDTPRERQQYFSQAANAINEGTAVTGVELSDLRDLTDAAGLKFGFSSPELGIVQGTMMILHLPAPPFGFTGLPYFPDQESREYDYVDDGPFTLVREYAIELPEGWDVAYMPEHESIECDYGRWLIDCTRSGNTLNLRRSLTVSAHLVDTGGYARFRKFFLGFTLPRQSLILLERATGDGS